jgi:hypothetical protein
MVAVIGRIQNISIIQNSIRFQALDDPFDKFINCLECSQPLAIIVVVVCDNRFILTGQFALPRNSGFLLRVEVCGPRYYGAGKEMLVSLGGDWSKELEIGRASSYFSRIFPGYVAVRSVGSSSKEEWFASFDCIVEETVCFFCQDISRVLAQVTNRFVVVSLECAVQVLVCIWVKKEVLDY